MAKIKTDDKKSFIMYVDYQYDFAEMTGDECKELLMIIFNYERTHEEPVIQDKCMRIAWGRIKRDLDRNDNSWLEKKEKLSEAGKRGAEKRWGNKDDSHPIASDSHPIDPITSIAVNVNENVNVNEFKDIGSERTSSSAADIGSRECEIHYSDDFVPLKEEKIVEESSNISDNRLENILTSLESKFQQQKTKHFSSPEEAFDAEISPAV